MFHVEQFRKGAEHHRAFFHFHTINTIFNRFNLFNSFNTVFNKANTKSFQHSTISTFYQQLFNRKQSHKNRVNTWKLAPFQLFHSLYYYYYLSYKLCKDSKKNTPIKSDRKPHKFNSRTLSILRIEIFGKSCYNDIKIRAADKPKTAGRKKYEILHDYCKGE